MNSQNNLIFNDKFIDTISLALHPKVELLINEGVAQSGKSAASITAFFEAVQDSDEQLHLISCYDLNAIRDKILNKEKIGLLDRYGEYCSLTNEKIGSPYISVKCDIVGKPKNKKILLCGFADRSKWKNILGNTIGCALIDEVNTANEDFINEVFARQLAVKEPFQIWTLNGDRPSHFIYTKYINTARVLARSTTPASILADMDKVKKVKGRFYQHWGFSDNPIMTPERIERAMSVYPVGSFYYTTKLLGERGTPNKLIYLDYFSDGLIKKIVDKPIQDLQENEISIKKYTRFMVGCDIGATKAMNSFTLTGFTSDFHDIAYIDKDTFKSVGFEYKKQRLIQFIKKWRERGIPILAISVDSAEANFIRDLKAEFSKLGLPDVISSYKATIKERIDAMIILASSKRVIFNDTVEGRDLYDAFMMCQWVDNKEGVEREDLNEPHNDKVDSAEYSFTTYMKSILLSGG